MKTLPVKAKGAEMIRSNDGLQSRTRASLNEPLEKRLRMYVVGAGSLGLMGLAQPVSAKIVFTPVNVTIKNGKLPIDLNHDGIVDFYIEDKTLTTSCCFYTQVLRVNGNGNLGAGVVAAASQAAALRTGSVIGPADRFANVQNASANMATAFNDSNSFFYVFGKFANATDRFLGLKFQISGQTHYGWAEFTFVRAGFSGSIPYVVARLQDYAYDTVPNKPVRAGDRSGDVLSWASPGRRSAPHTSLQPATLGLLALGSQGLNAWRRREG